MAAVSALSGKRREIAMLLSEQRRSMREIARPMGKPSSAVYRLVHRMVNDGILEADSDPPTRGTLFWLNPAYRDQLDEDVAEGAPPGTLAADQRLLVVRTEKRSKLYGVLRHSIASGVVAWLAELDGAGGYLMALHSGCSMLQQDRLVLAFEEAEISVQSGRVGSILAGHELRLAADGIGELVRGLS